MEPEKKSNGAFVGLVIIIIILIVGGIYMWQANQNRTLLDTETITTEDSVGLDTLEADVNATDIDVGVDANSVQ